MTDRPRVVWILGAGFSASLGGPLLARLLSKASQNDIEVRYPTSAFPKLQTEAATYVRRLYRYGLTDELFEPGFTHRGERMWGDAEEFIDYLDTAADDRRPKEAPNPHADRLNAILRTTFSRNFGIDELRSTARRLVAAECCAFLEGADLRREQWTPFRVWAERLGPHDTVITFNYDRVLEQLRDTQNEIARTELMRSKLKVLLPGEKNDEQSLSGVTPVLKLHGSVDWKKSVDDGLVRVDVKDERFALHCEDRELAIATPGPSKRQGATEFKDLWGLATVALELAEVVAFVGYRFPETDADARSSLLWAIGKNRGTKGSPSTLAIHIVLGSSSESKRHADRLAAMLRFACAKSRIVLPRSEPSSDARVGAPHFVVIRRDPLFAQDFFSVADHEDLTFQV